VMVNSIMQGSFDFSPRRAGQARDEAMARAEASAHDEWKSAALEAVYQAASHNSRFIVDEVWSYMPGSTTTHELRAMGPVMRRAARAGWICATQEYVNSARVTAHGNPRRIWQSLLIDPNLIFQR